MAHPRRAFFAFPALLLLGVLLEPRAAPAAQARIPGVSTRFSARGLRVAARLENGLLPEMAQRLASGLPTSTLWEIRLFVFRNLWPDGLKDERRYEVTATYRPVSSDYTVERRVDGRLLDTRVVPSLQEAASALSNLPDFPAFLMGRHLLGKDLVVRVRCTYGVEVSLGVVPSTAQTPWVRSGIFEWKEGGP